MNFINLSQLQGICNEILDNLDVQIYQQFIHK